MKPYYLLLLLSLIISSCGNHQPVPSGEVPLITDSIIQNIQTGQVVAEDEADVIRLNGKVEANEARLVKVFALVSGKIESVNVELGDYVQKGQVLAVLKSAEVAGASNDLSLAESNVAIAKKALEATKELYDGKLATEQDYINSKINYNKALSELNKARQVASITGGENSFLKILSPLTGFIIEKNISNSSAVRPDNSADLFAIADLSDVWIMANVYEADISSLHLGDSVIVNTLAKPDKDYFGRINKIYNVLDPATRTMRVRISMPNPGNELKPEMFASVKVNIKPKGKRLAIPSQAIVMDNSKNYVIVKNGRNLSVREITLIKRIGSRAYISGISVGEQVVTNSQVFLYQALTSK